MNLVIITPDKKIFEGEVDAVKVPGTLGSFEVLKNHAPIISSLEKGDVRYKTTGGEVVTITIDGGVVEVLNNEISLLAEKVL